MWEHDSRLDAKPNFGSLGPGPDVSSDGPIKVVQGGMQAPWAVLAAVLGLLGAVALRSGVAQVGWQEIGQRLVPLMMKARAPSAKLSAKPSNENPDRNTPQGQAELLLEDSVHGDEAAAGEAAARAEQWRGHIQLTSQLSGLITAGLNSNDLHVRATAIEVDLAALDVAKESGTVDRLEKQAQAGPQQQRVWALWTLGLLGNRGVEPDRVNEILSSGLRDPDPEIRHWAVEGMSYLGTDDSLEPLLRTLHDDASPMVRESAACGLAQSGMFTDEQRHTVVPRLLDYTEDSTLDAPTHAWVYHALRDITGQNLSDNAAPWRNWYQSASH